MRYEIQPDTPAAHVLLPLSVPGAALVIVWWVQWGFNIWVVLAAVVLVVLAYISNEAYYRLTSYMILQESHIDVRQSGWRLKSRFYRQRIPYSRILRLRVIDDAELEVIYARPRLSGDPDCDMKTVSVRLLNPHLVAVDLQGRVERASATASS